MNRKIVISSNNKNKLREIKGILRELDVEVLSKNELGIEEFHVLEDGETLEENSIKKARKLKEMTDHMVIADDSGLFVSALNGEPGVHSSRYAGKDGDDWANNQKLLENLKGINLKERSAYFESVIALITEKDELILVSGKCPGHIGFELQGENDFGYDPLFIPSGYEKSFAQLDSEIKNKISHRGKALEKLKLQLKGLLER